jgi:flagellin-like protein
MGILKVFEIMAFTKKNDEAVSPVIGVILMVAITVILAAVIAAFVFGMAGNISKTKVVAMTAHKTDASDITVMNNGGQDQSALTGMNVTTPGVIIGTCVGSGNLAGVVSITGGAVAGNNCGTTATINPQVGSTIKVTSSPANGYSARSEVTVTGGFNDGTTQVLLDTYI